MAGPERRVGQTDPTLLRSVAHLSHTPQESSPRPSRGGPSFPVSPERVVALLLPLPSPFSCHPSPQAEDLFFAFAVACSLPPHPGTVISTEGGAFAAAVERPAFRFCRCCSLHPPKNRHLDRRRRICRRSGETPAFAFALAVVCSPPHPPKNRHLDRRRRILPPQRRDPRISLLHLLLSVLRPPKILSSPHLWKKSSNPTPTSTYTNKEMCPLVMCHFVK